MGERVKNSEKNQIQKKNVFKNFTRDLPEINFISICSEKKNLITPWWDR